MEIQDFEKAFESQCPNRVQLLRYLREAIGKENVSWSDLTKLNLTKFADLVKSYVSLNSAKTYFNVLCGFLGKYAEEDIIPCKNPHDAMKAKQTPQQNVALTEDELAKIERYYSNLLSRKGHQAEKDCLTLFLIECYCGARSCDVENITESNIHNGVLSYVSQKTHILAIMPAHRKLDDILSRKPTKEYTAMTKNRVIKRVAMKCGITEPVTIFYHGELQTRPKYDYLGTHTARRTFASILSSKGAPIAEISQFMSHTNQSMTSRYIKADTNNATQQALSFFNG